MKVRKVMKRSKVLMLRITKKIRMIMMAILRLRIN